MRAVLKMRTRKASQMESTPSTSAESTTCISTQNLHTQRRVKLSNMPAKKGTYEKEYENESESKSKPREVSKKHCTCAPTTHKGSFRCRFHRIDADKTLFSKYKSTCHSLQSPHMVEFKPQLSRFGRAASAELVMTHDGLGQTSVVGSS